MAPYGIDYKQIWEPNSTLNAHADIKQRLLLAAVELIMVNVMDFLTGIAATLFHQIDCLYIKIIMIFHL